MRLRLASMLLSCLIGVTGAFLLASAHLKGSGHLRAPLPLEDAGDFAFKRDALAGTPGFNVVLLGDSLGVGRTMALESPFEWRTKTLDRALAGCLEPLVPEQPVTVWNFSLDGAIPNDFLALATALTEAGADAFIYNINLRSLSDDFNQPDTQNSRDWIAALNQADAEAISGGPGSGINRALIRASLFDNDALEWTRRHLHRLLVSLGVFENYRRPDVAFELLLKVKARYRTIQIDPDLPQVAAVAALARRPDTIAFLTAEQEELSRRIVRPDRRASLIAELEILVDAAGSAEGVSFLAPPPGLNDADFLDYIHVTGRGYELYAERICEAFKQRF